ncbi:Uncharacterised protein [Streptobacillus moniliformis]|nr:hypothetical protein [Streptobacillus moniliformis]SQA13412.1 Uncharacterised protein [Streptobacillus moniliformis]
MIVVLSYISFLFILLFIITYISSKSNLYKHYFSVSVEKPITYEKVNSGNGSSGGASSSNEMQIKELWKQDDVTNKIGAKGNLGVFMHKNKEIFAFIGTDLNGVKDKNNEMKLGDKTPYHFGLRWDSDIVDTFNIQLTAAHRRGGKDIAWEEKQKINADNKDKVHKHNGIKEAIEKHLTSKGKKVELRGDLNYKLKIKEDNGNTTLTHEPEVKLGATIKPTTKLSLISDNSNKVTIEHKTSSINNLEKINNDFKTSNKIKLNVTKGLDLHTLAEYKLGANLKASNGDDKYNHALLTGAGLSLKKEIEEVNIESTIDLRYLFDTKHKENQKPEDLRHQGFVWTENKVSYEINDNNKIEGKVNLYNQVHFHTDKDHKVATNGKDLYDVFLASKPITYEKVNSGNGSSGGASSSNEMQIKELWKQDDVTNKIGAKGNLGVFMHKNKEIFAFIGTDLNGVKDKNNEMKLGDKTPYHFGLRWDADIVDTFNIQLTAAHRRGGKDIAWEEKQKINADNKDKVHKHNGIKEAIEKHLTSKGKKVKIGKEQGYKLGEEHMLMLNMD